MRFLISLSEIGARIKKTYFDQGVNEQHLSFACRIICDKYFMTAIEYFFSVLHSVFYTYREMKEFSIVIQTLDCVLGLQNCLEFWKLSLSLDEAMKARKKVLSCLSER